MINRLKFYFNKILVSFKIADKVICIGDSHTSVFDYINYNVWFSGFFFKTKIVHGATASGIQNPNSTTQARIQFDEFIDSISMKNNFLIIQLGEVDCGFVIWYRAQKLNISVEKQLDETVTNYQKFVLTIKEKVKNCIVMSAVLPTIQDGQDFGEVANKRKEVRATLKERTKLTRSFNQMMKDFCKKNNISFLDLDHHLIDMETGMVKKIFLNEDPLDHHLSEKIFAPLIVKELKNLVK